MREEIDVLSEKIPLQEYARLYIWEATLRWLIKYYLGQKKISEKTISKIRSNADKEKERLFEREKEGRVPKTRYVDFVGYLSFPEDYIEIITEENWPVFEPIFEYKSRIVDGLKALEPLRHNIAHIRPLNKDQREFLNSTSRRIVRHIWDYINETYLNRAEKYEKEGFYEKAREALQTGLDETRNELLCDEGDPWIAYKLGKLLKKMGQTEEAKKWLEYAKNNMLLSPYRELVNKELE